MRRLFAVVLAGLVASSPALAQSWADFGEFDYTPYPPLAEDDTVLYCEAASGQCREIYRHDAVVGPPPGTDPARFREELFDSFRDQHMRTAEPTDRLAYCPSGGTCTLVYEYPSWARRTAERDVSNDLITVALPREMTLEELGAKFGELAIQPLAGAPDRITISPELREALAKVRTYPPERGGILRLIDGAFVLGELCQGERMSMPPHTECHRANGLRISETIDFHTHPNATIFSPGDVELVAHWVRLASHGEQTPVIGHIKMMKNRVGDVYLAVPTAPLIRSTLEDWVYTWRFEPQLFRDRLLCRKGVKSPIAGVDSSEFLAVGMAERIGVAVYKLDGDAFVRMIPLQAWDDPLKGGWADLLPSTVEPWEAYFFAALLKAVELHREGSQPALADWSPQAMTLPTAFEWARIREILTYAMETGLWDPILGKIQLHGHDGKGAWLIRTASLPEEECGTAYFLSEVQPDFSESARLWKIHPGGEITNSTGQFYSDPAPPRPDELAQ